MYTHTIHTCIQYIHVYNTYMHTCIHAYLCHDCIHDNFLEVSVHFVRTNSRMSRHSHICSNRIAHFPLLSCIYAVASKHTYIQNFWYFHTIFSSNLAFSYFYYHVHYVFICKTVLLHSVQVKRLVQLTYIAPESTYT